MINIGEIIRETMPETLWSNVIGKCALKDVGEDGSITVEFRSYSSSFSKYGEFVQSSKMCNLFPSEKMQYWNKFAWKIGDVLVTKKGGFRVIFDSWANDSYTEFYGYCFEGSEPCIIKSDNPKSIEWCHNKMNELKYEYPVLVKFLPNSRQEFKDGDIVTIHKKGCDIVFILNRWKTEDSFYYYAFHTCNSDNIGIIDERISLPFGMNRIIIWLEDNN